MKLTIALIFVFLAPLCLGQVGYTPFYTTTVRNGNVVPIGNAPVAVCTYPANAVPCSNYAVTYTDGTGGTQCTLPSQLIITGVSGCTAVSDAQGNAGFWAAAGNYDYTITVGSASYGPFHITIPTSQVVGQIFNAASFSGADWSVKTNAAISAAPSGTTVDMRGFTTSDLSVPGSQTITENKQIHVIWPSGNMTFNSCPGIDVTYAGMVWNTGQGFLYSYNPSANPRGTALISGAACPLVRDLSSQGAIWENIEFNGNSVGTVGILSQANGGSGYLFRDIHVHHFLYTGLLLPGTGILTGRLLINNNGGDAILTGSSPQINPDDSEIVQNGGNGIHSIGEAPQFHNLVIDDSTLHNVYFDGRIPPNWSAVANFISPSLIKPVTNNAGAFYFYSENVNCTTGGANPVFPQTIGDTVVDGTCIWVNISTLNAGLAPNVGEAQGVVLTGSQFLRAGHNPIGGFQAANVMFEGASNGNRTCGFNNNITGLTVTMSPASSTDNADGLHLKNCGDSFNISGYVYTGKSFGYNTSAADGYGFIVENSDSVTIQGYNSSLATKSPLKIISSNGISFTNMYSFCWSNVANAGNDVYAVQVDTNSHNIAFSDLRLDVSCETGGSKPNEKSFYNAGPSSNLVYLTNYEQTPNSVLGTLDTLNGATLVNAHGYSSGVPIDNWPFGIHSFWADTSGLFHTGTTAVIGNGGTDGILVHGYGAFDKQVKIADEGSCTTSAAGACAAQSLTGSYVSAPKCVCTWNGTGALTGILKCPSTTSTVTPQSTVAGDTTAVVNWVCFGN